MWVLTWIDYKYYFLDADIWMDIINLGLVYIPNGIKKSNKIAALEKLSIQDNFRSSVHILVIQPSKGIVQKDVWRYDLIKSYKMMVNFSILFALKCKIPRSYLSKIMLKITWSIISLWNIFQKLIGQIECHVYLHNKQHYFTLSVWKASLAFLVQDL